VTGHSLGAFDERAAPFWHAALDSLPDSLAVLDHHGDILAVNETWRRFAEANGGFDVGVGTNYLSVTKLSSATVSRPNCSTPWARPSLPPTSTVSSPLERGAERLYGWTTARGHGSARHVDHPPLQGAGSSRRNSARDDRRRSVGRPARGLPARRHVLSRVCPISVVARRRAQPDRRNRRLGRHDRAGGDGTPASRSARLLGDRDS